MSVTKFTIRYTDKKHFDKPMPSPRPRSRNAGKFIQHYMPTEYMKHKEFICRQMPKIMSERPIKLTVLFLLPMPKSWGKKKKNSMNGQYVTSKPDNDNLIKTILDAGNKHTWKDDSQIVEEHVAKRYGYTAKTIIKMEEL